MDDVSLARVLARVGATSVGAEALGGGYGGASVRRVRARFAGAEEREVVVKVGRVQGTEVVPDDAVDARVYAARSWSLAPVNALLRQRGLPTYDLLGWGFPDADVPFFWLVMSVVDGEFARGHPGDPDRPGFHRVCGEALGALHAVGRSFDGAVDRTARHDLPWSEAFFGSLDGLVRREAARPDGLFRAHEPEVRAFVDARRARWVPPRAYALSHTDGLQGHVASVDGRWRYAGHVDLEDYVFTDARFPLAGYELGAGGPLPPAFWEGYRAFTEVDPSYEAVRPLFGLYYLLSWFWLSYDPGRHPTDQAAGRSAARRLEGVLRTVRA
jgi:hypothetical protein